MIARIQTLRTARVERAAWRKRAKQWHRSVDWSEALVSSAARHRCQQSSRVRMLRVAEHLAHRPLLDDAAGVHHGDAVGRPGDDAEVVA